MKKYLLLLLLTLPAVAQTVNTSIYPAQTGLNLGRDGQRWNAYIQNLDVNGTLTLNGGPFHFVGLPALGNGKYATTTSLTTSTVNDCAIWVATNALGDNPCALLVGGFVPVGQLGSGSSGTGTLCLRDNGTWGSCSGTSSGAVATVYPTVLPGTSTQGTFGLLYPSSGLKNLSVWNGANWFNTNPYDSDAGLWGCDNTGATDASACITSVIQAVPLTQGQSVRIPRGTFLINSPLRINREINLECDGGMYDFPGTTLLLGPGANIVWDGINTSSDGGTGQWGQFKNCKVKGTTDTCTATSGSGVLTACTSDPSVTLGLAANDYIVVMGFNGTSLWGLNVPQGTRASATTSTSITLAGGILASASGSVTVMKSGFIATTGTTTNASAIVSGLGSDTQFHPGDNIQGAGIPFPAYVNSINAGAHTLTMSVNAGAGAGTGNLTKGPLPNITMRGGSVVLEDVSIDLCAGDCYDVESGTGVVSDGQYANRVRITHAGNACAHYRGSDANTSTDIGLQMTYCSNSGIFDESFLGNVHIGSQVANSSGYAFHSTGANASILWLNPYVEGGQKTPLYSSTNLVICGLNEGNMNNISGGNQIGCNDQHSPTAHWFNDIGGNSQASSVNGSPTLTGVTNISTWHVGDPIVCSGCAATTLISATDGVSVLTMNKNATLTADNMAITQTRTIGYSGAVNTGPGVFGFGTSTNGSSETDYSLDYQDPYRLTSTSEVGDFTWIYRNSVQPFGFSTLNSTAAWDFNGANNMDGWPNFYRGIRLGTLANKVDVRANASAVAPTTGQWGRGSLAIDTLGGMFQEAIAAKSVSTGHTDIALGSTALANQDAAFLAGCAPTDSITGTGIGAATTLIDQNTLSKAATATTSTLAIVCTHLPKAHVTTTCDTSSGTNTLLNCSTISGWAINDPVRGTGIPAGAFISVAPSGTTITMSTNATASNTGITVSDAAFNSLLITGNAVNTGIETKRAAGCATAASLAAVCTTTVTWPIAFADTNYTATCSGDVITSGVPLGGGMTTKVAASVTFQTVAGTAAAAQYTIIDCTAVHD